MFPKLSQTLFPELRQESNKNYLSFFYNLLSLPYLVKDTYAWWNQVAAQTERVCGIMLTFDYLRKTQTPMSHLPLAARILPELIKQPIAKPLSFILWT